MGMYLDQIPPDIQGHIRQITKTSGLPDTEDSVELIASGWLEKKELFEKQMADMRMEEVETLPRDEERGCLVMTYSGSLLNIGPLREEGRHVEYASVGLRQDVPETAAKDGSQLSGDVVVGAPVDFAQGPIQSSSPVFKIAAANPDLDLAAQEKQISKATQILTKEFVEVNKELDIE
jgi:hypothetical protein